MSEQLTWSVTPLPLELKFTWRISRNASDHKTNFVVKVSDRFASGIGEVAPNIRYGESAELVQEQFNKIASLLPIEVISTTELTQILKKYTICNSLLFGLTSAYLHLMCSKTNITVAQALQVPETDYAETCFSLPVMPLKDLQNFIGQNNLRRFSRLKVKVAKNNAAEIIKEVSNITGKTLFLDGNEAWDNPDEVLALLDKIKKYPVEFIEQPMPAALVNEYQYLKNKSRLPIFADESVKDQADFELLKTQFDGVNIKLMKAGGYFNGVNLLKEARQHGLKTMIGCMIESSLGISSALNICALADYVDLDGFLMLKSDPFTLLTEENGRLKLKNN